MSWWHDLKQWRQGYRDGRDGIPSSEWHEICQRLPLLATLDAIDSELLGQRAWAFLRRKRLTVADGETLDMSARLALAAQACLLTLGWDDADARHAFANVHEVVVVRDAFRRRITEMDEAGVVHEYDDERVGETWFQGPVVVSLHDLTESGYYDGFNVVIHEFAHKLDMGNSLDADGFPPLPRDIAGRDWHRIFTAVWDDLQGHLERGEPTAIDAYAASHPGECFAVCCEAFFSAPQHLDGAYPELYALLVRYFHQDPLTRQPDNIARS